MSKKKVSFISFDQHSKDFVLGVFGKGVDKEGYIVELATKDKVLAEDGEPLLYSEWGGIRKGSEIFFKNDLPSAIRAFEETTLKK